jgi:hypothetical protein
MRSFWRLMPMFRPESAAPIKEPSSKFETESLSSYEMHCLTVEPGDNVLILFLCREILGKNVGFHRLGASSKRPVGLPCMMPIARVLLGRVVVTTFNNTLRVIST